MIGRETRDGVAVLALDRPQRRNALSTALVEALDEALTGAAQDPEVGAIVLTGASPGFCAGSDLGEMGRCSDEAALAEHQRYPGAVARRLGLLDKPVVAAVEGFAFGGGFILAVSCDLVVTADDAVWNLAEVPNGFLPPWGLTALAARVGPVTARRLTWGFERLDGTTVQALGAADYVVPGGGALERALAVAAQLAALPPAAVAATKRFYQPMMDAGAESRDAAALRAFVENCREPGARALLNRYAGRE
ncbi:enoyl-CoA hydratase/isomerase family protein [Aquisalimonas lutea]|uniref:enoyl-CoA hydratase/isomerase family protein n=1 Tax=Aquisalimonas lutea TaxID=1327750 RepID=UPI0025B4440E|nr:enoyl-CoA hydratase/isomerase family protein [Aquisalimonas lutea]MDN3518814.1 enoyl-CoA hydratase/isomerase family protein [Aquisalimonas lutea]